MLYVVTMSKTSSLKEGFLSAIDVVTSSVSTYTLKHQ